MKKVLLLAVVLLLTLAACGGGDDDEEAETIKLGGIHDLTGPTSDVSTPYADGVRDYVKFVNANGGIDGRELEFMSQDYAYAVDQAEQLYSQYTSKDIVGFQGWGTGDTEALRGRVAEDKIPFMSASYSEALANPAEAPYNFLVGTSYSGQFIIALQYAKDNGASTVALMHHDSPFGTSPLEDGKAWAEANGMEIIAIPMPGGTSDFTAQLTQVADAGAEYIIIQNVSSPAATLAKDVARLGMDTQIVCLNWCSDELFVELSGDAAEGTIAASPFAFVTSGASLIEDEIRPYTEEAGVDLDAKGVHYVQGWVTMRLMVDAIREVAANGDDVTGESIHAALEGFTSYSTGDVTTPLTYTSSDHAGNKALRLYEVKNGVHEQMTDYIEVK